MYMQKSRDEVPVKNSSCLILNYIFVYHILLCIGNAENNAVFIYFEQQQNSTKGI